MAGAAAAEAENITERMLPFCKQAQTYPSTTFLCTVPQGPPVVPMLGTVVAIGTPPMFVALHTGT